MAERMMVPTSRGPVEIVNVPGNQPYVLFFPGGHCSAVSDCGWSLYTDRGLGVLSFSRPGYGATDVGDLTAGEFAPLVREVCLGQGITNPVVVGVSFGGLQAMAVAGDDGIEAQRLVLHSCAPSTLPYPDSRAETLMGPVVFSPWAEMLTWSLVRLMVRTDTGLGLMMAQLSRLPRRTLMGMLAPADKAEARRFFGTMRSDRGFTNDLRQAKPERSASRRALITGVRCPTLVTASHLDAGVAFEHARDLASRLPNATLVELDSPSHLLWIGPGKEKAAQAIRQFLSR
ncbi:alpha/beta fold hydrolase [Paenarthrobacter sp. NPDC090520]|uniref:alpha/beta fold hydrolase n=1 Tax=Paenarthrobacter sp. NPDC090520 TaxID=3364382 RepID=UPI003814EE61